jgi:SAM-dependent methyltransferase
MSLAAAGGAGVFDLYAAYYDLLYRDKPYAEEAAYTLGLVDRVAPGARRLLELGCGTGGHAVEFARTGVAVHGIDLSPAMVERARAKAAACAAAHPAAAALAFEPGDLRRWRSTERFDATVSLFHVMSYQTTDADLAAAFATARAHLAPGAAFVFDAWWGPAVLSDRPRAVDKHAQDDKIALHRRTAPTLLFEDNIVEVRFDIDIQAHDGRRERVTEVHRMRYLFGPEVKRLLRGAGFELLWAERWLHGTPLDDRSWYAVFGARAV